ncbi:MAG: EscU/YscU/HrcU family type III secretion system export apparatus switch protein [Gemmatimonadaceae bacterium]|nr:EscU/YscU/HrcU family type III secretion system export apparatus switch protein [Gemmatimonadaceae bacterium]
MAEDQDEKTELPTAKKRSEAVQKGQIWKSTELNAAVVLLGSLMILSAMGPDLGQFLLDTMGSGLANAGTHAHDAEGLLDAFNETARHTLVAIAKISVALAGVAVAIAAVQAKGVFTLEPLTPSFARLNPVAGLKRLLPSGKQAIELAKQLAKVTVVGLAVWSVLGEALPVTGSLAQQDPRIAAHLASDWVVKLMATAGFSFLAIAIADVFWQRFEYEKSLKMTKDEVKQENKSLEGDGNVKARRRALGRQRIRQQMMANVPKASVVIVNPTHIAIALQYDPMNAPAPIVVAMGQRKVAERIKAIALESGVPIIQNRPLARAMIKACQVGQMIPAELYTAVAEVLAFVFRQRAASPGWRGSAVA